MYKEQQVELLTNGGYDGTDPCIGKVFTAILVEGGYRLPMYDLEQAGFNGNTFEVQSLFFVPHEVRPLGTARVINAD